MRRFNLLLAILFVFQIFYAQDKAAEIRRKLLDRDTSSVLVVAHRGDWRNFPENSLEAVDNAIRMGVDIVELDVQRTKDGHIIVIHDKTLDRTTTGRGKIEDWTLDSIKTLKLKNGCAIKTKHQVSTLREVLLHAKGNIMINLDKADRYFDEIYPLLEETGTTEQIIMKGKKTPDQVKKQFGKYLEKVIYMPVVDLDKKGIDEEMVSFMTDLNPVAYELLYKNDSNQLPKEMKVKLENKSLIWYNTLWDTLCGGHDDDMALEDLDGAYGYLINELGARILQTDRPEMLLEYLRRKGLHD